MKLIVILVHSSPTLLQEEGRVVSDRSLKILGVIVGKILDSMMVPVEIAELFGAAVAKAIEKVPDKG